jgi:hypothetical protein
MNAELFSLDGKTMIVTGLLLTGHNLLVDVGTTITDGC